MHKNPLLNTDSYKLCHFDCYPKGLTYMMSYFESRGGEFDECTLFGLQPILEELSKGFSESDIYEAEEFAQNHGEPFPLAQFQKLLNPATKRGEWPVRIRAVPEGTVVPTRNVLMTVESTNPECAWVVSYLETMLSRVWYPSTIAISSRESKKTIMRHLERTAMDPEVEIAFKLHDFGFRGVSSYETAALGGAAHLLNFMGSDTIAGVELANRYGGSYKMQGYSIPATEHSIMSMLGPEGEYDIVRDYIQKQLVERQVAPGITKLAACVGDTYNIFEFVQRTTSGELLEMIENSGGCFVCRPDSGDPLEVLPRLFRIAEKNLGSDVHTNHKGYKVLPPYYRFIWGDGIDRHSTDAILTVLSQQGWSASNIAFGSGGGLLQKVNRDTQKFAFKCCAAIVDGKLLDVYKRPITDPGKESKSGRLDLVKLDGQFLSIRSYNIGGRDSVLQTVFENGVMYNETTFDACRDRMKL